VTLNLDFKVTGSS